MAGRNSSLTKKLIKTFAGHIEKGCTIRMSCNLSGITETTYNNYINDAKIVKKALEKGKQLIEPMSIEVGDKIITVKYAKLKIEFLEAINVANANYLSSKVEIINEAAEKDWKAACWILERRAKDEFSTQSTVKVGNDGDKPFKQEVAPDKTMAEQFFEFQQSIKGLKLGSLREKKETEETE